MAAPSFASRLARVAAVPIVAAAVVGSGSDSDAVRLGLEGAVSSGVSLAAAGSEVVVAWAPALEQVAGPQQGENGGDAPTRGAPLRVGDG